MKKNVAIVAGGDQSEVEVSLRSAAGLYSFIGNERYNLYIVTIIGKEWKVDCDGKRIDIDKNDFTFLKDGKKTAFDYAYITIHGIPGEDGRLQGYFDLIGMPYSCCGVLAAALTYNKFFCNHYLKSFGVNIAESLMLKKGDHASADEMVAKLGLPCFVKPNIGGSSFGVTKVKTKDQLLPAIEKAFKEGDQVIAESFMQGTEITCGVYKTSKGATVFPVTEVVSANEFFDYDAKYKGQVQEITPARLSETITAKVQKLTSEIYDIIGAKGIIRIDYIITDGDKVNLLEINTTPGMTATSFIPQQVKAAGLDIREVLEDIIEN